MRNKLYTERLELCISKEQNKYVRKVADERGQRINEILRLMIDFWKENN